MAYDTKELEKIALDAIKQHKLVFFSELEQFVPSDLRTLYNKEFHELRAIKDALNENKLNLKRGLREKWYESDNATTNIALYKLISDDKEFSRLCGQQVDHTTGGDKLSIVINKNYNE